MTIEEFLNQPVRMPTGEIKRNGDLTADEHRAVAQQLLDEGATATAEAEHLEQVAEEMTRTVENRCRSRAKRLGLKVTKTRRQDPYSLCVPYSVISSDTNAVVRSDLSIGQLAEYLDVHTSVPVDLDRLPDDLAAVAASRPA